MKEKRPQTSGFNGRLDRMQLLDVVQMASLDRASRTISVETAQTCGRILIRHGQVIHADTDGQSGEEALYEILQWPEGTVSLRSLDEEGANTISRSWEFLLIEALRQRMMKMPSGHVADCKASNGFSVDLWDEPLPGLIHLAGTSQGGCCLELRSEEFTGKIWLNHGSVAHAEFGDLAGENALHEIFRMEGGSFVSLPFNGGGAASIDRPVEQVLIDAVRVLEETEISGEDGAQAESLLRKIQRMKIQEKVKLAMSGNKESRGLLMRDSSRLVQIAIISNPKITDGEIALIACSRTVDEDVLRRIAENREWLKNYQVRLALVNNPKTPVGSSTKLVRTLRDQDIRLLSRSRTVSTAVVNTARRIITEKG